VRGFHNDKMGNLDTNLGDYFDLFFIRISVGNLYTNFGGYFELFFVITEVGNLYAQVIFFINYSRSNGYY
jgi:hypothetical protein